MGIPAKPIRGVGEGEVEAILREVERLREKAIEYKRALSGFGSPR
jgi:hypothetical protein